MSALPPINGSWAAHPSFPVYVSATLRLKDSTSAICFGASPMAAVDYLYWSRPLEGLASGAGRSGEMWITGKASAPAAAKLAALGWKVVPNAGAKLWQ